MSNRDLHRAVLVTLLACVVGLGLGLLVAHLLRPSEEAIRRAAHSLVPPGAEIVNDTKVTGSPLIVGGYSVSVNLQGGAQGDDQLLAAVEQTAADGSWTAWAWSRRAGCSWWVRPQRRSPRRRQVRAAETSRGPSTRASPSRQQPRQADDNSIDASGTEGFRVDDGFDLDQYLFVDGSPLDFSIDVSREFGPVDGQGKPVAGNSLFGKSGRMGLLR